MHPPVVLRGVYGVEGESEIDGDGPVEERNEDEEDELDKSGVLDDDECDGDRRRSSGTGTGVFEPSAEGRSVRTPTPPYVPSEKERRDHDATHFPPRSWCPHCVAGRGMASQHRQSDEERLGQVGELHFDYCFLRSEPGEPPATTLVGVDRYTHAVLAHVVPRKGTEFAWVASQLERDVKRFGYHGRLVVKTDQEPAILDLMRNLARRRAQAPTIIEKSKAYDSQSNGRAENAVRRVEEQVRTMKLALEAAVGTPLDVHHPAFAWLVEHAADIVTKCAVGRDGRTPYERIKGKRYHGQLLEFGRAVRVKFQGKLQGGLMKARWCAGVWLGKKWSSDEHVVSLANGRVVRARDVRPMPDDQAFDHGLLAGIGGTPNNPSAAEGLEEEAREVPRIPVQRPEAPVVAPGVRRVMIHKSYLDRFGYTDSYAKCSEIEWAYAQCADPFGGRQYALSLFCLLLLCCCCCPRFRWPCAMYLCGHPDAGIHTCIHTYIHTYMHACIHTYSVTLW